MREIKASERVTGRRWLASVDAARRRVKDGQMYLIRRHGGWFRPDAHGYTTALSEAGIFSAEDARNRLHVEGLSVVPVKSVVDRIEAEIREAKDALSRLHNMLFAASRTVSN